MKLFEPDAQHFILEERLIQKRAFLGIISLPWSGETITPKAGISQEIYRNGTTYAHSVGPNFKGAPPKVYKGDYVYSISVMPRTYGFNGVITTKDGKARTYETHLELRVVNATRFMESYHYRLDPALTVFMQFKKAFEYYASKLEDITPAQLGPWLDRRVVALSQQYGIQAIHPVWFFHPSNEIIKKEDAEQAIKRQKHELDLAHELKIHEEKLKGDFEQLQKDLRRNERARNNEFARSEKKKGLIMDEQIRLLSSTVTSLIQINDNRVNDNIGYNFPPQEILKDSLRLLARLNNSLDNSPQEADKIVGSTLFDKIIFGEGDDSNEPITTANPTVSGMDDADK